MADASQQEVFYKQLGANIRKCRDRRGLSQGALANLVGLTRTSLTNIENGRQRPLLHTLCEMADHLKVDFSELLPRPLAVPGSIDVKKIAEQQVRDKNELEFIESAIRNDRSGLHGHQKKKNSGDGGSPSQ